MSLDIDSLIDDVVSHALTTGYFESVNQHEPKNSPRNGLTAAVWVNTIQMIRASGVNTSSARVEMNVRLYTSMLQEPQDQIDPEMVKALDSLFTAYAGDFTLGGDVRFVDLLGAYGNSLSGNAGYIEQDRKIYRVFTIVVPLIVDDVWTQTA